MSYEAWPYVHEEAKGMTPPPNAIRCPCGRGWLRVWIGDHTRWCDHSGRVERMCIGLTPSSGSEYVAWITIVRGLEYATTTTQETP